MIYVSITTRIAKHLMDNKKFFWVPTVYNIKFQKEFQSYHTYSGSIELGTRVYPLIEESLIPTVIKNSKQKTTNTSITF